MSEPGGKVALVTGGSAGIGAAIARRLADDRAAVALTHVNSADKAEGLASKSRPTADAPWSSRRAGRMEPPFSCYAL